MGGKNEGVWEGGEGSKTQPVGEKEKSRDGEEWRAVRLTLPLRSLMGGEGLRGVGVGVGGGPSSKSSTFPTSHLQISHVSPPFPLPPPLSLASALSLPLLP